MYATIDDFLTFLRSQELVEQSQWESQELFVNQEFAQTHLRFASSKIDGTLAIRYAVPVVPSPPQLKYICMRLAHWSCEQLGEIRQHVQTHYEQALLDLEKIAKGEAALIGADNKVIAPVAEITPPGGLNDRVFTFVGQRRLISPRIYGGGP